MRVQWNRAILLDESHKLDPMTFRWESKTKKWHIKAKPTWHHFWRENQLFWTKTKELKGELMIWRTKMQARVQGKVQLKESNLLQMSPNRSQQFGHRTPSKVGLTKHLVFSYPPTYLPHLSFTLQVMKQENPCQLSWSSSTAESQWCTDGRWISQTLKMY